MPSYGGGGEGGGDGVGGGVSGGYGAGGLGGTATGFGGVGTDSGVASTNPVTTTPTGLQSLPGYATFGLGLLGLGLPAAAYNGVASLSHLATTTSDISGNQTQFNGSSVNSALGAGGNNMTTDTSLGSLLGSAFGGLLGSSLTGNGQSAVNAADPFASQRPQYQQMLQQLMTNPNSYAESPAAVAATQQGMGQIGATMASRGLTNSGAESQALTKYATQTASSDYYNQMSNLMQMAGAGAGSTAAASQALQNQNASTVSGLGALGSQLGSAAQNWWNSSGTVGATDMTGFQSAYSPVSYSPTAPDTSSWNSLSSLGSGGSFDPSALLF